MSSAPILEVRDLTVRIATRRGTAAALDGITFDLHRGETLGLAAFIAAIVGGFNYAAGREAYVHVFALDGE
jgi:hypothetical protein